MNTTVNNWSSDSIPHTIFFAAAVSAVLGRSQIQELTDSRPSRLPLRVILKQKINNQAGYKPIYSKIHKKRAEESSAAKLFVALAEDPTLLTWRFTTIRYPPWAHIHTNSHKIKTSDFLFLFVKGANKMAQWVTCHQA